VKLQQEAKDHIDKKKQVFEEGLQDHFTWIEEYLNANLFDTEELGISKQHLTTTLLWVKYSVDKYGIK
tara:strand:+ start:1125 stop:1328 length:204 start_codon:yes stop_codon:yes gene_type:complete